MSLARTRWTLESFLEWEERQELRYEFDGVQPVAMTGGTAGHDAIQINIVAALHRRLVGKPCRVHGCNLKINVMGRIRYPDAFVPCTPLVRERTVATDPVVIFEVLSPTTAHIDGSSKNREYAATGSVRRYVMVESEFAGATVYERHDDAWTGRILGPEQVLLMPEIGIEVPLAEFYQGIDFADAPAGGE